MLPIENTFKTKLSQELGSDATDLTFVTDDVPTATVPGSYKVVVVIEQGKAREETVICSAINTSTNTWTISSSADRALNIGNGYSGTRYVHPAKSEVIITNAYALWADVKTAIESKVDVTGDTMTGALGFSGTTHAGIKPISLTTAQRTALSLTGSDTAIVYDSDLGDYYEWKGGAWYAMSSGSTQPNADTTTAGKVEVATTAEVTSGATTGGTGASLVATPGVIAASEQKQEHIYAADSGSANAITVTLTPAPTSYTTGMRVIVKLNASNTGATTINVNSLGVKSIKKMNDQDPASGDLESGQIIDLVYDGTYFQLQTPVASDSQYRQETFTAYEAVSANDAVALLPIECEYFSQLTETDVALGDSNTRRKYAVKFIPVSPQSFTTAKLRLKKASSATQTITVSIQSDSSGAPSGSAVTNGTANTIAASGLSSSYASQTVTWASAPSLSSGTTYWLVIEVDATDATNYVVIGCNNTYYTNYPTFTRLTYNLDTTSWGSSSTTSIPFFWTLSTVNALGAAVVPCDADVGARTWGFIGFAASAASAQATVSVYTNIAPRSSLVPGKDYYISSTAGQITTTIPDFRYNGTSTIFCYRVGRALSTTELLVEPGEKYVWGSISGTGTTTTQIIVWLKMKVMEITGSFLKDGGVFGTSSGIYDGTNNYSAYGQIDVSSTSEGSGIETGASFATNDVDGSNNFVGVGSAVTNAGLTYTVTKTGTMANFGLIWKLKA